MNAMADDEFETLKGSVDKALGEGDPEAAALKVQLALIIGSALRARKTNDWGYLMMVIEKMPFTQEMPSFAEFNK